MGLCVLKPQRVELLEPVKVMSVRCGCYVTVCIDVQGNLWTFGRNDFGQLGMGLDDPKNKKCNDPQKLEYFAQKRVKIVEISCGAAHTVARDSNSYVYAWGLNNWGQIGNGKTDNQLKPVRLTKIDEVPIVKIHCGYYHNIALSEENHIYTWGRNDFCQCTMRHSKKSHSDKITSPYKVPYKDDQCRVKSVFAGNSCSVIVGKRANATAD